MTQISAKCSEERIFITIKGHNRDTKICFGISALLAALDGWCASNCDESYFYMEGDGEARVNMPADARCAAEVFCMGVMRLEKTYPDNVKTDIEI